MAIMTSSLQQSQDEQALGSVFARVRPHLLGLGEEGLAQALRRGVAVGGDLELRIFVRIFVRQVGELPAALALSCPPVAFPHLARPLACIGLGTCACDRCLAVSTSEQAKANAR